MNSKKVTEFNTILRNNDLLRYLESVKIRGATDIQKEAIPRLLEKNHCIVQGKTGSGKTYSYLLPLISRLKDNEYQIPSSSPRAVIVAPTRELALQIFSVAKDISHFAKLRIRKLVGGDKGKSLAQLKTSFIDVLITTPDRALRIFKNKELKTDICEFIVFDEADQLLEPSFKKTVGELVTQFKKETGVFLVSASAPKDYLEWVESYFPNNKFEIVGKGEENILSHKVQSFNIRCEEDSKNFLLKSFVKKQGKSNGVVFTGNKARAKKAYELVKELNKDKAYVLHKDLEVKERVEVVEKFKKKGGILVATDIFARGMDINHLEWVLNYDLPSEPDYYLHRSGRVGRAGKSGKVFNFVTSNDKFRQKNINEALIIQGRNDLRIKNNKK